MKPGIYATVLAASVTILILVTVFLLVGAGYSYINRPIPLSLISNETATIPFNGFFSADTFLPKPYIKLYGTGTYTALIKTNHPEDVITAEWFENVNCVTVDKFGTTTNHGAIHWSNARVVKCTSDKKLDCQLNMELTKSQKDSMCTPSGITMEITGHGSGEIIITKTSGDN